MGNCVGAPITEFHGLPTPPIALSPPSPTAGRQGPLPSRIKVVLLGDAGVGKSCLALRYVRGTFDAASRATVGAAFLSHTLVLPNGGGTAKLEIWDTAGQERYQSIAPMYYRGAHAALLIYDVTNAHSFERAKFWAQELQAGAGPGIVMVLVGNKTDLWESREVSEDEGRDYADSQRMVFVESSAKMGANVAEVFEGMAQALAGGLPVSSNAEVEEKVWREV